MSDILKTTSYHIDDDNGLMLSKRGSLWAISVDTTDGVIEVEMTAKAACAVREFFADATCDACKAAPEPQPAPEPEPVVDLVADLAAVVAQLADIVTELAATHDRIDREDDLR